MFNLELFVSYFLAVYFLMIGLYYTARSYAMSEREGFSFITYGPRFSAGWWHRHLFNVFRGSILAVCVVRLFVDIDPYLGLFHFMQGAGIQWLGLLALLVGYFRVTYVAGYMHKDWCSGLANQAHQQSLITTGPYAKSRNPLFTGILIGQLGFFLALPSVFSLVCLLVGVTVINRQARVEEGALKETFGEAYERYFADTPRWYLR